MTVRSTRQTGWFFCSSGKAMEHFTTNGGLSAACNRSFTARVAPLNDGSGNGREIKEAPSPEIFTTCPRCIEKSKS